MIPWISPSAPPDAFPPLSMAMRDPNGLLAAGGDLSSARLTAAYRRGIFPWYSDGEPILWWSPDPRAVIFPDRVRVSRRLAREIRQLQPQIRLDGDFSAVIHACAAPREHQAGTWITPDMIAAYERLFRAGIAHCAEALVDGVVVGGIYGLAIGRVFFGESMVTRGPGGSKLALVGLCRWLAAHGYELLDGQVESDHLLRMGARPWPRERFVAALGRLCDQQPTAPLAPGSFCLMG